MDSIDTIDYCTLPWNVGSKVQQLIGNVTAGFRYNFQRPLAAKAQPIAFELR
jgi:hypothetical protein